MILSTIRGRALFGAVALSLLSVLGADAQNRTVTLRLNTATLPDTTKITDAIEVRGCLAACTDNMSALPGGGVIAWDARTTLKPVNRGGDYWDLTFQIPSGVALDFKFFSPQAERGTNATPRGTGIGGWEDGSNHQIAAGTGNVNLMLSPLGHFYEKNGTKYGDNDKAYDWRPFAAGKADSVAVFFRVYMATVEAQNDGFNPQANPEVGVRGDPLTGGPLDWGATKIKLTRESTDRTKPGYSMYSGVAYYANSLRSQTQAYKFFFGTGGWEDGNVPPENRRFKVPQQDTTLQWVFFGNTRAIEFAPRATAAVTFTTDLTPLQTIGIFDRAGGDSIEVRGGFNGWDCAGEGSPDDCLLRRRPVGNLYDLQYTFVNTAIGSTQEYKFFVNFRDDTFRARFGRNPPSGWEENINTTGINRSLTFTGAAGQTGTQFFQGILPENIIPNGTTVNATFRVDMRPALTFAQQPFVPTSDSVFVRFEDPFWLFTQGDMLTADGNPTHLSKYRLTDPDGDRVYTGTFPLRGATINNIALATYSGVQYRYEFGNATKGYFAESGTSTSTPGRRRTRFIVPTSPGQFPGTYNFTVQPERIQLDAAPLPFECNPAATGANAGLRTPGCLVSQSVAVERIAASASSVKVGVYPNPARGSARFQFDLPQAGQVSLKLYDAMGRQVATVVEGVQPAGTYNATFNTSELAAGVYVYRLTVGATSIARTLVISK